MEWTEVFAVFIVSHLVGDYLLQTEWQALNKRGGLGGDPVSRRALLSHICTYTLAFVPATVWLAGEHGASALGLLALIAVPHLIQDDGKLLSRYIEVTKRTAPKREPGLHDCRPELPHRGDVPGRPARWELVSRPWSPVGGGPRPRRDRKPGRAG